MKVVLIGHVCIDVNSSENSAYTSWGSALMYIAYYFHRQQGVTVELIAPYGNDFHEYAQVVTLLTPAVGAETLLYRNVTQNNFRTQRCENADIAQPINLTEALKQHISEANIVCLAPLLPNFGPDYVSEIMAAKSSDCISVLLPQGYFRTVEADTTTKPREFEESEDVVPKFDLVILSDEDHRDAAELAQCWARVTPASHIILTQGSVGASLVTATDVRFVRTDSVPEDQIVDSVGCGDTFAAAVMYSYARDNDIKAAIQAGNLAARAKLFQARPLSQGFI